MHTSATCLIHKCENLSLLATLKTPNPNQQWHAHATHGWTCLPSLSHCLDGDTHLLKVVKAVKNSENVDAVFGSSRNKGLDDVVRIIHVAVFSSNTKQGSVTICTTLRLSLELYISELDEPNEVRPAKQHLQTNVWHRRSNQAKTLPRVLVQESHRHIKGGPTPAFHRKQISKQLRLHAGTTKKIDTSESGCHQ